MAVVPIYPESFMKNRCTEVEIDMGCGVSRGIISVSLSELP
jgi:hypothetical protein